MKKNVIMFLIVGLVSFNVSANNDNGQVQSPGASIVDINGSHNNVNTGGINTTFDSSINTSTVNNGPSFGDVSIQGGRGGNATIQEGAIDVNNTNLSVNNNANTNANTNEISNVNNLNSTSNSNSDQTQHQGQSQNVNDSGNSSQGQAQSANNNGNAQNVNINTPRQHRMVPSMANFVPMPTSPCMATLGGSGAASGIGISIAGSYVNENCEIQEASKTMLMIGQPEAAVEIACTGKHASKATICREINQAKLESTLVSTPGVVSVKTSVNTSGTVVSTNSLVRVENEIRDLNTGKVYGYVVSGQYRERNTMPSTIRPQLGALLY